MGSVSIGIKLADNKFFPIMDGGIEGSKMLDLTTVSENQESVQIHLYRSRGDSPDQTIRGAEYIGTLIIEDIARKPAGAPTIKLKIALDGNGVLSAEARDIDSGMRQSLRVSLRDLSTDALAPAADFDITGVGSEGACRSALDGKAAGGDAAAFGGASFGDMPPDGAAFSSSPPKPVPAPYAREDASAGMGEPFVPESLYDSREAGKYKGRRGIFVPAWLCVLILVAGIALLASALVFAWRLFSDNSAASRAASPQVAIASPEFASAQAGETPQASPPSQEAPARPSPQRAPSQPAQPRAPEPAHSSFAGGSGAAPSSDEADSSRQDADAAGAAIAEPVQPAPEEPAMPSAWQDSAAAVAVAPPAPEEPAMPSAWQDNAAAVAVAPPAPEEPAMPPAWQDSAAASAVAPPEPPAPEKPAMPPAWQDSAAAVAVAPPVPEEPTPPPAWQDNAAAVAVAPPEPPAQPEPAPAAPDARYLVKWGDTLWDLAETFYRDPWRFSDIARRNGIRNPSLIVAGTYLAIPAE